MSAGISPAVLIDLVLGEGVKGKLKHIHAREVIIIPQHQHLGPQVAEIFRDNFDVRIFLKQGIEELMAGSFDPLTFNRGRTGSGNLPVGIEGPEVIETDDIKEIFIISKAAEPEGKAVFLHILPVIDRVSPALAGGREVIGRHPGDKAGISVFVQQEVGTSAPAFGAVEADIERNVSHDLNAFGIGVFLELLPLFQDDVLNKTLIADLLFIGLEVRVLAFRKIPLLRLPFDPADHMVFLFQRHEQSVVLQPLLLNKRLIVLVRDKVLKRLMKIFILISSDIVIGDEFQIFQIIGNVIQKPLLFKQIQRNIQLVNRKGRERLVWAVSESERVQRKNLPNGKPRFRDVIYEAISVFPEITESDPIGK